ncbi:hypothetical protein V8F33_004293 [Rhypophila sp. PSN 637]
MVEVGKKPMFEAAQQTQITEHREQICFGLSRALQVAGSNLVMSKVPGGVTVFFAWSATELHPITSSPHNLEMECCWLKRNHGVSTNDFYGEKGEGIPSPVSHGGWIGGEIEDLRGVAGFPNLYLSVATAETKSRPNDLTQELSRVQTTNDRGIESNSSTEEEKLAVARSRRLANTMTGHHIRYHWIKETHSIDHSGDEVGGMAWANKAKTPGRAWF